MSSLVTGRNAFNKVSSPAMTPAGQSLLTLSETGIMLDFLDNLFDAWRKSGEFAKLQLYLATLIGLLFLSLKLLKLLYNIVLASLASRLYLINQFQCCQVNYIEKYGKWVIITGATDGIGLSMAKEFASRGHSLVIIGRNEDKLEMVRSLLEKIEQVGEVETIKIDFSDSTIDYYKLIREQIEPDNKDIGILINNAGIFVDKFKKFNQFSLEEMEKIINVNTLAPVLMTKLIMPSMLDKGKGLVVNVSSMAGSLISPYLCVYGPTKSFLTIFSRQLSVEYSSYPNIDIINLTPGAVVTNLFAGIVKNSTSANNAPLSFSNREGSLFMPSADHYALKVINALGTRVHCFSGTWPHALSLYISQCLESIGINVLKLYLERRSKQLSDLSPVIRRSEVS